MQENERRPQTLTLKWRQRNEGYGRTSASCPVPTTARPPFAGDAQASAFVAAALALLARNIAEPFYLTLLNIGASNAFYVNNVHTQVHSNAKRCRDRQLQHSDVAQPDDICLISISFALCSIIGQVHGTQLAASHGAGMGSLFNITSAPPKV